MAGRLKTTKWKDCERKRPKFVILRRSAGYLRGLNAVLEVPESVDSFRGKS